jgi:hypothetical protein
MGYGNNLYPLVDDEASRCCDACNGPRHRRARPAPPREGATVTTTMAVVMERVTSRAERQVSTELVYLVVAVALANARRQHDLVRPAAVNRRRRQLASATHARTAA